MKIQKTISLTVQTAAIASQMHNFSQWVRIGLRAHADDLSLGSEVRLRIKWAKAANYLASMISECEELNPTGLEHHEIIAKAFNHAQDQMTLEEFE